MNLCWFQNTKIFWSTKVAKLTKVTQRTIRKCSSLMSSYSVCTGLTPDDILLGGGYWSKFPQQFSLIIFRHRRVLSATKYNQSLNFITHYLEILPKGKYIPLTRLQKPFGVFQYLIQLMLDQINWLHSPIHCQQLLTTINFC